MKLVHCVKENARDNKGDKINNTVQRRHRYNAFDTVEVRREINNANLNINTDYINTNNKTMITTTIITTKTIKISKITRKPYININKN